MSTKEKKDIILTASTPMDAISAAGIIPRTAAPPRRWTAFSKEPELKKMKTTTEIAAQLSDDEICLGVQEVIELREKGQFKGEFVRALAGRYTNELSVPSQQALVLAKSEIVEEAARRFLRLRDSLVKDLEHFKTVSAYLAMCHAATTEESCDLKSTSEYRKERLRNIAASAALFLEGEPPTHHGAMPKSPDQRIQEAIKRCREASQ